MKTITEMQKEIKNISSLLEELSKDIMEFGKGEKEKISEDIFERIKSEGKRNPIKGHPVAGKEDMIKNHYMTLLISAIYVSDKNTLDAWLIAQRIACGISLSGELEEIGVDALSLTEKQLDEFTYSIIENRLEEVFCFDLLLIYSVCGSGDIKMLEYLADMFSLVNCSKTKIMELSELAKIVIRQNREDYLEFCIGNHEIDLTQFFCYIELFHHGLLVYSPELFYIRYPDKRMLSDKLLDKLPEEIISRTVLIENTLFENVKDKRFLKFRGNKKIEIKNCRFKNVDKAPEFADVSELVVRDSEFIKMDGRALYVTGTNCVLIENSEFTECSYRTDSRCEEAYGGALYFSKIDSLTVSNSSFKDCYARHGEDGCVNGAAAYMYDIERCKFVSDKFTNCYCEYYRYASWWKDCGYLIGLGGTCDVSAENCIYKNCSYISSKLEDGFRNGYEEQ